jgi:hypothetical protein
MHNGWFAEMTDAILDACTQDIGREAAIKEKMRQIQNQKQHMQLIRKLPNLSTGQLISNGWLHLDLTVRDNTQHQREVNDGIEKEQQQKR